VKLLFDENLSRTLGERLRDIYPDARHVAQVGLESSSDKTVWEFARTHGLTIVSKDSDFNQFAFLFGPPRQMLYPTARARRRT
jgi:predicted nuclease of predicted toxin-antitoxin system